MDNDRVVLYEDQRIRTAWNEAEEEWYFSVVDVVQVLTDSTDGRKYWNILLFLPQLLHFRIQLNLPVQLFFLANLVLQGSNCLESSCPAPNQFRSISFRSIPSILLSQFFADRFIFFRRTLRNRSANM